jgi:hypothetical protein
LGELGSLIWGNGTMTAKSPTGRFGIFFGLKRRPSSNFQNNQDLPPFYHEGAEIEDPFAAHYVPSPVDVSSSPSRNQSASGLEHGTMDPDPPPPKYAQLILVLVLWTL